MARLLQDYDQDVVTRADYAAALSTFARTQQKDGRPYIAEASDPFTGSWAGHNTFYHSEHYFHSSFVDLVISGLVGLRPQADESVEVTPLAPEGWNWLALDGVRSAATTGHRLGPGRYALRTWAGTVGLGERAPARSERSPGHPPRIPRAGEPPARRAKA